MTAVKNIRNLLPSFSALYTALASVAVIGPLAGPGYWLFQDAVTTPRTYPNDQTLGIGDVAPRAVPQDWILSVLTHLVDGGVCVVFLTWLGLFLLGWAAGTLAALCVGTHPLVRITAITFALINPYCGERLAQGQWSLLLGLGAGSALFVWILHHHILEQYSGVSADLNFSPPHRRSTLLSVWLYSPSVEDTAHDVSLTNTSTRMYRCYVWATTWILATLTCITISSAVITAIMLIPLIIMWCWTARTGQKASKRPQEQHLGESLREETQHGPQSTSITQHHDEGSATATPTNTSVSTRSLIPVLRSVVIITLLCVISSLPWLVTGILSGDKTDFSAASSQLFRFRNDASGPLTSLALAGIWNGQSVTLFRSVPMVAFLQSIVLGIFFISGIGIIRSNGKAIKPSTPSEKKSVRLPWNVLPKFFRWRKKGIVGSSGSLAELPVGTQLILRLLRFYGVYTIFLMLIVASTACSSVAHAFFVLERDIPGAGVFRDTHKFLGATIIFCALLIAMVAHYALQRVYLIAWIIPVSVGMLCADNLWADMGTLASQPYPRDFTTVAAIINAQPEPVASVPAGIVRHYPFVNAFSPSHPAQRLISIDPFPRLLQAPVHTSGEITVDNIPIDQAPSLGKKIEQQLLSATTLKQLSDIPVRWVIVHNSPGRWGQFPQLARLLTPVYHGQYLTLYRNATRAQFIAPHHQQRTPITVLFMVSVGLPVLVWFSALFMQLVSVQKQRRTQRA